MTTTDPNTTTDQTMRFYRHTADGHICWTYPTNTLTTHYTSPRPGEGPGHKHCPYPHDNPDFLTELPDKDARLLLNPNTRRDALINRIHQTINWDFVKVSPGENEPGYPTARSLSIVIADTLITTGATHPQHT